MNVEQRPSRPIRRVAGTVATVAVTIGAALGSSWVAAACSGPKADPDRARLERVEERLRSSFSDTQARCIVDRSDPSVIRALDRTEDLEPEGELMAAYSDAVAACVTDVTTAEADTPATNTTAASTTAVEPPTTTTAPPG